MFLHELNKTHYVLRIRCLLEIEGAAFSMLKSRNSYTAPRKKLLKIRL